MATEQHLFPLMIDLSDKKIIILGDGNVAQHKASLFSNYAKQIEHIKINPLTLTDSELLERFKGAFLVIPATADKQLNSRLAGLASKAGCLANQVDCAAEVVVPSVISHGDLTIGISTKGAAPALTKYTRQKIEQLLTPEYSAMARLQAEIRDVLKNQFADQQLRKKLLWKILESEQIWLALSDSYEKAYQHAISLVKAGSET